MFDSFIFVSVLNIGGLRSLVAMSGELWAKGCLIIERLLLALKHFFLDN